VRWHEIGDPDDEALVSAAKTAAVGLDQGVSSLAGTFGNRKIVMLGESSHGTHEFYALRDRISRELIENHGFKGIAVEGDWPPASSVNRFVRGESREGLEQALRHFHRWPIWMWANRETAELLGWLRARNESLPPEAGAGFYGLDVYSLFESISAVSRQLGHDLPFLAKRIRDRYACFDRFAGDELGYARSLLEFPAGCQEAVVENLRDLLRQRLEPGPEGEALFDALQNARIAAAAENYYRTMVHGNEDSWNVRDRHMLDTLDTLMARYGGKWIVWAHNTHIGDHRATDMLAEGQVNIGGLAREKWGKDAVALVGFGTYEGEVIASHAWDGPVQKLTVPPAAPGSHDAAFQRAAKETGLDAFYLDFHAHPIEAFAEMRGQRAIGVVYQPRHERIGNYVPTVLSKRYDAFFFFSRTRALEPLPGIFDRGEIPETWPQGM
jgi:erythromycin esterase-like protein